MCMLGSSSSYLIPFSFMTFRSGVSRYPLQTLPWTLSCTSSCPFWALASPHHGVDLSCSTCRRCGWFSFLSLSLPFVFILFSIVPRVVSRLVIFFDSIFRLPYNLYILHSPSLSKACLIVRLVCLLSVVVNCAVVFTLFCQYGGLWSQRRLSSEVRVESFCSVSQSLHLSFYNFQFLNCLLFMAWMMND